MKNEKKEKTYKYKKKTKAKLTALQKITERSTKRKVYREAHLTAKRLTGQKFLRVNFRKKSLYTWLFTRYFGMGKTSSRKAVAIMGYCLGAPCKRTNIKFRKKLEGLVSLNFLDFFLRRKILSKILLKQILRTRQGRRLRQGLPCRGQRTKSNAGTPARMRQSQQFLPFPLNLRKIREAKRKRIERRQQRAERRERRRIARLQKKNSIAIQI